LKPILFDDSSHASDADVKARLTKFLGDDLSRRVWIEEPVSDDLSLDFFGADVIGPGSAFLRLESKRTLRLKNLEQLIISLSSHSILGGGLSGAQALALAFDEHDQAGNNVIARWNHEFPGGADNPVIGEFEAHGTSLRDLGHAGQVRTTKSNAEGHRMSNLIWQPLSRQNGGCLGECLVFTKARGVGILGLPYLILNSVTAAGQFRATAPPQDKSNHLKKSLS
jgi:hypothetical protein